MNQFYPWFFACVCPKTRTLFTSMSIVIMSIFRWFKVWQSSISCCCIGVIVDYVWFAFFFKATFILHVISICTFIYIYITQIYTVFISLTFRYTFNGNIWWSKLQNAYKNGYPFNEIYSSYMWMKHLLRFKGGVMYVNSTFPSLYRKKIDNKFNRPTFYYCRFLVTTFS